MSEVTFLNDAVKNIVKQPVLTIEHLTAQETAPRVILAETRRRMQVAINNYICICIMISRTFRSRNYLCYSTFVEK